MQIVNSFFENHLSIPLNLDNRSEIEQSVAFVSEGEQAGDFVNQWPAEWYALERSTDGRIRVELPQSLWKVERMIYIFRNRKKERFLIGKTAGSLNGRLTTYVTQFNKREAKNKTRKGGRQDFFRDVRQNPDHFDVGILHKLQPEEDLNRYETLFIKCKGAVYDLYNDNQGGGGGSSHAEEVLSTYAIPKDIAVFTPQKYYRYRKGDQGQIRPDLTPGFKKRIRELQEGMDEMQEFFYAIKKVTTDGRYIGVSNDPLRRSREHGYDAEYFVPEHDKYDPSCSGGYIHPAMAECAEQFGVGLLPIQSAENIDPNRREDYVFLQGIANVEKYIIEKKKTLFSENGYNANRGGGGPIARSATRFAKKKLDF
jgi:GIY-YIG catalytic domain